MGPKFGSEIWVRNLLRDGFCEEGSTGAPVGHKGDVRHPLRIGEGKPTFALREGKAIQHALIPYDVVRIRKIDNLSEGLKDAAVFSHVISDYA